MNDRCGEQSRWGRDAPRAEKSREGISLVIDPEFFDVGPRTGEEPINFDGLVGDRGGLLFFGSFLLVIPLIPDAL